MLQDQNNQEKFEALLKSFGDNTAEFYTNPIAHLQKAGIPLIPAASIPPEAQFALSSVTKSANLSLAAPSGLAESEQIKASTHWWGVDLTMNAKLTDDIINGIAAGGALAGLISTAFGFLSFITAGMAGVIGAGIAAIVAAKVAQIKITNNGKGVHWPITWVQWAALVAAIPTGPGGIVAAGMLFLHPVRN